MKRFFRNLKTLAMCALVGVATLAVSCSEAYDDTLIKQDIEDLKNRVEALEIKLTNEVNALKALIEAEVAELEGAVAAVDAKIAILDYTANADGSYTLTTKDGENITVYPQFTENNDNLLTVMTDGRGDYYWAQIVNGVPVALTDKNGNKYYVHNATQLPEGLVPTQVRQDADGANEVSFDGGLTWHKLGGGGDLGLFQSVTISEDGKSLTFVLNGGQSFTTTLPEEFSFAIDGNKVFFTSAQKKTVAVKTTGIKDLAVAGIPAGWKVEIEGGVKLNVTAPSVENVAAGVAAEAGVVYVLAISNEGKAVLGKLAVSAGKGYTLSVKMANAPVLDEWGDPEYDENYDPIYAEQLSLVVTNEQAIEFESYGSNYLVYNPLIYGVTPKAEFSIEALQNGGLLSMYGGSYEYYYGYDDLYGNMIAEWGYYGPEGEGWYVFDYDTYEYSWFDVNTITAKESAVAMSAFGEITPGVEYVLWAAPWKEGASYMDPATIFFDELVYDTYVQRFVDAKQVDATTSDIQIDVTVAGYDSYLVLGGSAVNMTGEYNGWTNTFDYWQMGYTEFGVEKTETTFSGSFFDFIMNPDDYEHESGIPGTEYMLCILPLEAGKVPADYTYADVQVFTFKTENLQGGGASTPTISLNYVTFSDVNMTVSAPAEETAMIYYKYYRAAAWSDEMADWSSDKWVSALLTGGSMSAEAEFEWNYNGAKENETLHFVAFAVDKQGKYGDITIEAFTTKQYTGPSSDFVVSLGTITSDMKNIVIPVSVTGGEVMYYKYIVAVPGTYWTNTLGGTVESLTQKMAIGGYGTTVYPNQLVDGCIVVEDKDYKDWNIAVVAFDADMNVSAAAIVEPYTHFYEWEPEMLLIGDEGYETGEPTITLTMIDSYESTENPAWSSYTVNLTLEFAAETKNAWVLVSDPEYEDTYNTPLSFLNWMVNDQATIYGLEYAWYGYSWKFEETTTGLLVDDMSIYNHKYIYYTWTTEGANGEVYRECKKFNVREALGLEMLPEEE